MTGKPYNFGSCEVRIRPSSEAEVKLARVAKGVFGDVARVAALARGTRCDYKVDVGTRAVFLPGALVDRFGEHILRDWLVGTRVKWEREAEAAAKVREATGGEFHRYNYDMIGAQQTGETRHPETVIREMAPHARRLEPVSIADCWLFVAREISPLPAFIREQPICGKRLERDDVGAPECGGACVLHAGHEGGCECIADDEGQPGSCPA